LGNNTIAFNNFPFTPFAFGLFKRNTCLKLRLEDETTCTMCGGFCASRGATKLFADDLDVDKI
jgi:hypothetical protein